jgi:hypothetical protein
MVAGHHMSRRYIELIDIDDAPTSSKLSGSRVAALRV